MRFDRFEVKKSSNEKALNDFCYWVINCNYLRAETVTGMLYAFSHATSIKGTVKLFGDYNQTVILNACPIEDLTYEEQFKNINLDGDVLEQLENFNQE